MKKIALIVFLFCGFGIRSVAQSNIIQSLQEDVPGQGVIRINSSYAINNLISFKNESQASGNVEYVKASGHRIQVFSGNQQRKSKTEAFEKQQAINEVFPDIPTYLTYNAPYWRLRVGDCATYEEAYFLMKQITKELPDLKREMHVVKDEVKIPVNDRFE